MSFMTTEDFGFEEGKSLEEMSYEELVDLFYSIEEENNDLDVRVAKATHLAMKKQESSKKIRDNIQEPTHINEDVCNEAIERRKSFWHRIIGKKVSMWNMSNFAIVVVGILLAKIIAFGVGNYLFPQISNLLFATVAIGGSALIFGFSALIWLGKKYDVDTILIELKEKHDSFDQKTYDKEYKKSRTQSNNSDKLLNIAYSIRETKKTNLQFQSKILNHIQSLRVFNVARGEDASVETVKGMLNIEYLEKLKEQILEEGRVRNPELEKKLYKIH